MAAPPAASWLRFVCDERIGVHVATYDFSLTESWTCLFGPSGSGKTTVLRLLAGLLPQQNGTCTVHGTELRLTEPHRRRIALVDQPGSLFPHRTVRENVAFGGRSATGPTSRSAVDRMLDRFGLTMLANARPRRLSGGEAQRVSIARAVFSQPDVLLLDESFSGLDQAVRERLRDLLLGIQRQRADEGRPMPILSVTHDVGEVFASAVEVLRMQDGRITAQGPPQQVLRKEREDLLKRLGPAQSG